MSAELITGQSQKEKDYHNRIKEKNANRKRLTRGVYVKSELLKK